MGYYNQRLSLVRDVIETTLLMELLEREPSAIAEWCTIDADERQRKFGAYQVRMRLEKLEEREGKPPLNRKEVYKRFCTYRTHPSPESFVLISPDWMTKIGPFPDPGRLKAMLEEVVQHAVFSALVFPDYVKSEDERVLTMKGRFFPLVDQWADEFVRGADTD
jgi:hypothetical protein